MARLNEPPIAPATGTATSLVLGAGVGQESVEVLKRRFIRQNRELAKNNSSQSLRIRSLELEVSKLLGDNLELREQILGLQTDLYRARVQSSSTAAQRLKTQFRAQIVQLSSIVDSIDPDEDGQAIKRGYVVEEKERILSPSRRDYRARQPLADLMQESQMPTISEDKHFPQRTMNAEEMGQVRLSAGSGSQESPELGPPPVAHFEELASQDLLERNNEDEWQRAAKEDVNDGSLLPSVEITRRKRKEINGKESGKRPSIDPNVLSGSDGEKASNMLRTGAKRKLADRDVEKPMKPPLKGDFTFSRKSSTDISGAEKDPKSVPIAGANTEEMVERPGSPTKLQRKVLGDKSTNISPRKATTTSAKASKGDPTKPAASRDASKDPLPSRSSRRISSVKFPPSQEEIPNIVDVPLPEPSPELPLDPKTPGVLADEFFSPPPSHPSAGVNHTFTGTPPPAELSAASHTTEGSQRPSRRARAAVSYAEPSLIAKMRRPDKKMVDAVSGLQDPRRAMSASARSSTDSRTFNIDGERRSISFNLDPDQNLSGAKRTGSGMVKVKDEPQDDVDWENVPLVDKEQTSPLHRRAISNSMAEIPPQTSPIQHVSSSETHYSDSETISVTSRISSGTNMSTLIAQSRKRREALDSRDAERKSNSPPSSTTSRSPNEEVAAKMAELELYDFKDGSSPASVESSGGGSKKRTAEGGSRRHSSMAKGNGLDNAATASAPTTAAARASSRRRSMMV